jgi:hypothetical protein
MNNITKLLTVLCTLALLVSCGRDTVRAPAAAPLPRKAEIYETAPWGAASARLQCSIACSNPIVTPFSPVDLVLRVRNNANGAVRYHLENCDGPTYQIQASWPNGENLQFSDLVQQEHDPCGVTNWITLAAGETNRHNLVMRMGTFLNDEWLFAGSELGAPIKQYDTLSMKLRLMDIESNTIKLIIKKETP